MTQTDPLLAGAATIRGDLRDYILANLAGQTKLWRDMPQAEQQAMAQQIDSMCAALVTQIAVLTATGGRPAVLATLENISVGAECRAVLSVPKDQAGALIPSAKQIVAIMQPSAAAFMGQQAPAKTQPDQLSLVDAQPRPTQPALPEDIVAAIDALCGTAAERTVPETDATLKLQQQALIDGRRAVQMFPTGTKELPLPEGMERVTTSRGVFHFNPDEMDVVSIVAASDAGEENLVLGLGPHSKAEVLKAVAMGEEPVAVMEATPDGTEVLAALTTRAWADELVEIMERGAAENHTVAVVTVDHVISRRLAGGLRVVEGGRVSPGDRIEIVAGGGGAGSGYLRNNIAIEDASKPKPKAKRAPRKAKRLTKSQRRALPKSPARTPKPNGHAPEPQSAAPPAKRTGSPFA